MLQWQKLNYYRNRRISHYLLLGFTKPACEDKPVIYSSSLSKCLSLSLSPSVGSSRRRRFRFLLCSVILTAFRTVLLGFHVLDCLAFPLHQEKMLPLKIFWRRHKRKILVTSGVLGGGYCLYKLYNAHQRRLADLERELAAQREHDDLVKDQMQAHFENIQSTADTTTMSHAMHYLSCRIEEEMDLSYLTERLIKGKGQPNTLTEKLELWERLKILSFTRMVVSLWALTILSLYIKVQVNILGRHLYIDTARGLGGSHLLENVDLIDREDQQKFLWSADFLANYGLRALIAKIQEAVTEVLKGKQLRDHFNSSAVHDAVVQIFDTFMSMGNPHQWVDYLMPKDITSYKLSMSPSNAITIVAETPKFDQLMVEARRVLLSEEFSRVVEISLKAVVDDMEAQFAAGNPTSAMPMVKLLPRIAQMCVSLLDEATQNRLVKAIGIVPDVDLFFTLLYSNMPTV